MPSNNIAFARNYTSVIDEVYQRASVSGVLNSGRRMVRAGHNAKEILIPKISVTGLGNYTRNVGYQTGAITYEFETKTFNYDRGIRLFADVMDVFGYRYINGFEPIVEKYLVAELKKGKVTGDDLQQVMKYVDWVRSEYANGDYCLVSAFLVGHEFDMGSIGTPTSTARDRWHSQTFSRTRRAPSSPARAVQEHRGSSTSSSAKAGDTAG